MSGTLPLAGRDHALAAVTALLDRAMDGSGGLLALTGPAGVGRTRIGEEADRLGRERGLTVVWGTAAPGRPGSPWQTVRRALARRTTGVQDAQDPLAGLPLDQPTVLVLDDLQHADTEAMAVLARLEEDLRNLPLGVVALVADDHDPAGPAGRWLVDHHALRLADLDVEACHAVAGDAADAAVLHARTGGVPMLLWLALTGAPTDAAGAAAVWDRRLADLHPDDVLLLQLLVAGQPVDVAELALLAHRPVDAVATRMERLAARGHAAGPELQVQPESLAVHLEGRLGQSAVASVRRRVAALRTVTDPAAGPSLGPPQPLIRSRLQQLLEDSDGVRAVAVIADAGFGKTTLMRQWAAARPAAWLSLQAAHDAPERLAADLLDRLPAVAPRLPVDALRPAVTAARGPDAPGAHGRQVAALLCEALDGHAPDGHAPDGHAPDGHAPDNKRPDGPALLILDDVHLLSDPEAVALVDGLVRGTPAWLLVVLAGRTMPPVPLERLQAAGEVRVVHGTDLAFDLVEVDAALALHLDRTTEEQAMAVHDLTDGWPMAVWLVAAELGRQPDSDPAAVMGRLRRPGQPLFAALVDEVLATCDPPLRQVLRAATAMASLPAGLAAAIGLPDAQRRLADLADRGLLLDAVASGEHRLKDLVAQTLVSTDPLAPWETCTVLRCAAGWFDDHRRPLDALRCLVDLAGVDLAGVDLAGHDLRPFLSRRGHALVDGGAAREVQTGLDALPVPLTATEQLLAGSVSQVLGDWERALHAFTAAAGDGPDLPAGLAWRIAMIHHHRGDIDAALEACRAGRRDGVNPVDEAILGGWVAALHWMRAEAEIARTAAEEAHALALRTGDPRALATTHAAMAMVSAMLGDRDADAAHYERAIDAARRAGDLLQQVRALVNRSSHHDEGGAYVLGLADADEAVRLAAIGGYAHWGALAQVNRGEALKRTGRLDEALQAYGEAHRAFRALGSRLVCYPLIEMAEVRAERGDRARALVELRQGIALAEETGDHQALLLALALQARLLAPDDPEGAQHSLDLAQRASPGMRGVWVELAAGWVALAQGDRDAAAHHAAAALAAAEGRADRHHAADAHVLAALAADPPDPEGLGAAEAVWRELGDPASQAFAALLRARLTGSEHEAVTAGQRLQSLGALGPLQDADRLVTRRQVAGAAVVVTTLGGFGIALHSQPVPANAWQSRKARDLLKLLVARRGRPATREALAEALWPGAEPDKVSNRLSVALSILRRVLVGPDGDTAMAPVSADAQAVALDLDAVSVDVEEFLRGAAQALGAYRDRAADAAEQLAAAEVCYTGDFLEEDAYADWAAHLREEARGLYVEVALALAGLRADDAAHEDAARLYRRVLERDPYDEAAHLGLVEALAAGGRPGEARRGYETYRERMLDLGVEAAGYPVAA